MKDAKFLMALLSVLALSGCDVVGSSETANTQYAYRAFGEHKDV